MKSRVVALLALLAAAASCSSAKTYEMRGQILGINRDKVEILVKHDEIPGLMAAMTMPWKVQQASMLDNLGPGDLIAAEIVVDNSQGVITKITRIGTAKPDTPSPAGAAKPGVRYLSPGDQVPNQAFVDQDGRAVDFNSIRGNRAMAVTFIYTKCPIPTFCPAMDRQFAEAQRLIKDKGLEGKGRLVVGELRSEERHARSAEAAREKARRRPGRVDLCHRRPRRDRSLRLEPATDAGARRGC